MNPTSHASSTGGSYDRVARGLHWSTGVCLALLVALGLSMTRMEEGDSKLRVFTWHEWVGVTVFGLTAWRAWWQLRHPGPPIELPWHERLARRVAHTAIYVVLIAQPITGWLMSTAFGFPVVYLGIVPLPVVVPEDRALAEQLQTVHFWLAMALIGLFAAHLGAVLTHQFVRRDDVLSRMWR